MYFESKRQPSSYVFSLLADPTGGLSIPINLFKSAYFYGIIQKLVFFFCRYVTLLYKSTHTLLFRSKRTSFEKLIRDGAAATARLSETFDRNISFLLLIKGCIIIGNGVLMSHFNTYMPFPINIIPFVSSYKAELLFNTPL